MIRFSSKTIRRALTASALALPLLTSASVLAHDGEEGPQPTGVVKERMDAMKGLKDALMAIRGTLGSEETFDQAVVTENAKKISAVAGEPLLALFPQGTNEAPSEALDNIWTDWENFKIKSGLLKTKADALAVAEGLDASKAAFGEMAQSCGGCHKVYRLEKEQ
ncbi:MAG: cytochrome c [Alphaproteobacteria bacterium]|nr:MAG: cytochrome c [Alphaproteobacteria bacterium]